MADFGSRTDPLTELRGKLGDYATADMDTKIYLKINSFVSLSGEHTIGKYWLDNYSSMIPNIEYMIDDSGKFDSINGYVIEEGEMSWTVSNGYDVKNFYIFIIGEKPTGPPVDRIKVTGPSSMVIGTTAEVRATSYPEDAPNRNLLDFLFLGDTDCVDVLETHVIPSGKYMKVKALKVGSVTIKAISRDPLISESVSDSISIKVIKKPDPLINGPTYGTVLQTETYIATGFPDPDSVQWSSEDPSVADVISTSGSIAEVEFVANREGQTQINAESGIYSATKRVYSKRTITSLTIRGSGRTEVGVDKTKSFWPLNYSPKDVSSSESQFYANGQNHCRVDSISVNSSVGTVDMTVTGLTEGTDVLTISNGRLSRQYTIDVVKGPDVQNIEITGPSKVIDGNDMHLESITSPDAGIPVDWTCTTYNLTTSSASSKNSTSFGFRPKLADTTRDGYADVYAEFGDVRSATKRVIVTLGKVASVEITGPTEAKDGRTTRYDADVVMESGDEARFGRSWSITGDARIKGASNKHYVDIVGELGGKETGSATLSVTVGDKTATMDIAIIPSLKGIVLRGSPSVDIGSTFEIDATLEPANVKDEEISWEITEGSNRISMEVHSDKGRNYAIIQGLSTGAVTVQAYSVYNPGGIFADFKFKVNGDTFGTSSAPLTKVDMNLVDCIGDKIYVKVKAPVHIHSEVSESIRCAASSILPADKGLEVDSVYDVIGAPTAPGEYVVEATYWDPNVYAESKHKVTIQAISSEGEIYAIEIPSTAEVTVGSTVPIAAKALPTTAKNKKLEWSVISGTSFANIESQVDTDEGGTCSVKGLLPGTARIKVSATDGSGTEAFVDVSVLSQSERPPSPLKRLIDKVLSYFDIFFRGLFRRVMLPQIESITETDVVDLTEIPTLLFGADNRFVTDLGRTRKITLNLKRVAPPDWSPADDLGEDQTRWSNRKWYQYLEESLDFWQNLGETPDPSKQNKEYLRTGGFLFRYLPPQYDEDSLARKDPNPKPFDLYHEIEEVVFLTSAMSPDFKLQTMTLSLNLLVARMTGNRDDVNTIEVRYKPNIPGVSTIPDIVQNSPFETPVPIASPPSEWSDAYNGYEFRCWQTSQTYDSSLFEYYPGRPVAWNENKILYAHWFLPKYVSVFSLPEEDEFEYNIGLDINSVTIYLIGAGGGSGSGESFSSTTPRRVFESCGGAGGGGAILKVSFEVSPNTKIIGRVGAGGAGGTSEGAGVDKRDGKRGGDTYISYKGKGKIVAGGGHGGEGNYQFYTTSKGGIGGGDADYAGGQGASYTQNGVNGVQDHFAGIGGMLYKKDVNHRSGGGSGGGCGPFALDITPSSGSRVVLSSKGGNGGTRTSATSVTSPGECRYGGGAGSAPGKTGYKGADGLVVIIAF